MRDVTDDALQGVAGASPATAGGVAPPNPGAQQQPACAGVILLAVLAQRASDKAPAVRAKAISALAAIVASSLDADDSDLAFQLRQVMVILHHPLLLQLAELAQALPATSRISTMRKQFCVTGKERKRGIPSAFARHGR